MARFFAWVIDRWIMISNWYGDRRDTIASLQRSIEFERETHRREVERLTADIELRDVAIKQLQEIIERDRARVAEETSIAVANRELAGARAILGGKA